MPRLFFGEAPSSIGAEEHLQQVQDQNAARPSYMDKTMMVASQAIQAGVNYMNKREQNKMILAEKQRVAKQEHNWEQEKLNDQIHASLIEKGFTPIEPESVGGMGGAPVAGVLSDGKQVTPNTPKIVDVGGRKYAAPEPKTSRDKLHYFTDSLNRLNVINEDVGKTDFVHGPNGDIAMGRPPSSGNTAADMAAERQLIRQAKMHTRLAPSYPVLNPDGSTKVGPDGQAIYTVPQWNENEYQIWKKQKLLPEDVQYMESLRDTYAPKPGEKKAEQPKKVDVHNGKWH